MNPRITVLLLLGFTPPAFASTSSDTARLPAIEVREPRAAVGRPSGLATEFVGQEVLWDADSESSLSQVLGRQAAIQTSQAGGEGAQPFLQMRGQDPIQTRFYLEGVPLSDALFQNAPFYWLPVSALDRVDLFPEGNPAVLGGEGMGGAVLMHLKQLTRESLGFRVGSFGSRRLSGSGSHQRLSLQVEWQESREDFTYRDDAGTPFTPGDDFLARRHHNGFRSLSLLPQLSQWKRGDWHVSAFSFLSWRSNELPGALGQPLQSELRSGYQLVSARVGWNSHALTLYGSNLDQTIDSPASMAALQLRSSASRALGGRYLFQSRGIQLSSGFAHDWAQLVSSNSGQTVVRQIALPVGVSTTLRLGAVDISPAIATQWVDQSDDQGLQPYRSLNASPRVGMQWAVNHHQRLRVVAGRYFRVPSLSERFGIPSRLSPNVGLKDEASFKAEAGWDGRWFPVSGPREWSVSATASLSEGSNLILVLPNSQTLFTAQNIGSHRIASLEAGTEVRWGTDWIVRANGTYLWTENLSPFSATRGKELPVRPRVRSNADFEWRNGRLSAIYSTSLSSSVFLDTANTRSLTAVWQHDLTFAWKTRHWGSWLLELRNLTDTMVVGGSDWGMLLNQNTTGLAGFPSPGRRAYLSWRYDFS